MESNALRYPFTIRINIQITAPMKNSISHINGFLDTFKGDTKVIEPTTKMVTNNEAPTNSPIANPPLLALNDENVPKTSGAPLPNAANVTPATLSGKCKEFAITVKFGLKNEDAEVPNNKKSHIIQNNINIIAMKKNLFIEQ
jgi:hypothetical protein